MSSVFPGHTEFLQVARYVENYANVSRFRSASAEIKDVDISKMTIYAGNRPYYVYFIPPLADLKEARERLVQMDKESLKRLNRSSVTLKAYLPPKKPFHVFMFGMLLGFYMLYSRKDNLYPGSTPYELIFKHLPKFTDFAIWARPFVFYPVLGIHIVEVVFMTFKLEKHSMPLFSKAWWAWIASTFIEGVGAFQRYAIPSITEQADLARPGLESM